MPPPTLDGLEKLPFSFCKAIHLMADHVDQVARNDILRDGILGAHAPSPINFKDDVLVHEIVQKGRYEQRLPLGALKQRFGEG